MNLSSFNRRLQSALAVLSASFVRQRRVDYASSQELTDSIRQNVLRISAKERR